MTDTVIQLYKEPVLVQELTTETVHLIHATTAVPAIKRLLSAYDLLNLNLEIFKAFPFLDDFQWDISALQELNTIRRELVVYHRVDFDPTLLLDGYNHKMGTFIRLVGLRAAPSLLD